MNKRVLIYCRESRDENSANYERIETQRDMLIRHCETQQLGDIVDIILDDNVSGTNFKRFDKIRKKINNKEIDIILFKDASRLGRNLEATLEFTNFAIAHDVEVVFESEEYNEDFFPLQAWFNEQRAKEDSKKIRRVMQHKMQEGKIITKSLYGYDKVKQEYFINEEEAKIVREVYDLFNKGYGTLKIATILNHRGVPTPSQSKSAKVVSYAWNRQHIYRIVQNETYTGKMIHHKRQRKNFKAKKTVPVDKKDWIIIENHHEPIISQKVFNKAHDKYKDGKSFNKGKTTLFRGLIFCGRCGSTHYMTTRSGRRDSYICGKNHKEGSMKDHIRPNYGCYTHFVALEDITKITLAYIRKKINDETVVSNEYYNRLILRKQSESNKVIRSQSLQKEIKDIERKIEQMYNDRLDGLLPQSIYAKKYKEFENRLEELKDEYDKLSSLIRNNEPQISVKELKNMVDNNSLTNQQLKKLFKKIVVFLPNEIQETHKDEFDLSDDIFDNIYKNGGIVFIDNLISNVGYLMAQ